MAICPRIVALWQTLPRLSDRGVLLQGFYQLGHWIANITFAKAGDAITYQAHRQEFIMAGCRHHGGKSAA
ncbi:MAG: hypothetical protein A2Z29_01200 [Chloroflexi bacterium RBG_16_56_11]|nr:MAG: hypothetical protein A2Z29_01200 [Chloroflexi bacterium RBG_16_56_11]